MEKDEFLQHHIYFEWYLNERSGGPTGYLANLRSGYNQLDYNAEPYIYFNNYSGTGPKQEGQRKKGLGDYLRIPFRQFKGGDEFFSKHFSRAQKHKFEELNAFLSNIDAMFPDYNLISKIDWENTRTIHVHTVPDVVKVKNYLRRNFLTNVKVILTCHTPASYANEQYNLYIGDGMDPEKAKILRDKWSAVERKGYEEADIMIFPSKEAEEPLRNTFEGFDKILEKKDVRYVATGTKGLHSSLTKEEAKQKYGVTGKTVIGFIGRHNSVKGYDLLKETASKILKERDDVVFLIGGAQGTEFQPLDDSRWIEAGWVNPADLLQALDLFVLPNRQTYYDLILLEVMSMGIPTVATATGGNISVKRDVPDLILCDVEVDSMAQSITKFLEKSVKEREKVEQNLLNAYRTNFTEIAMANRYVDTIRQICKDYEFGKSANIRNDLISVVIPFFNVEEYFEQCLKSVVNQTYRNLEILCVNDCTEDNCTNIVKNFMRSDSRVKLILHKENRGLGGGRNTGIRAASGKYIMFVDSDDLLDLNMIEKLYTGACKNGVDTAVCGVTRFNNTGWEENYSTFHYLPNVSRGVHSVGTDKECITDMWPSACNKLFSMEIIKKYHCEFPEKLFYEDHIFHYQYFSKVNEFYYTNEYLYKYRADRPGSITTTSVGREEDIYKTLLKLRNIFSANFTRENWKAAYAKICFRLLWERQFVLLNNPKVWLTYTEKSEKWLSEQFEVEFLRRNVDAMVPKTDSFYKYLFLDGAEKKVYRFKMQLKKCRWLYKLWRKIKKN